MFRHRVVAAERQNFWTEAKRLAQTAATLADDNETLFLAGKQPMAEAERTEMARRLKEDSEQLLTKVRHATGAELRIESPVPPKAQQPTTATGKGADLWTALVAARQDPSALIKLLQNSWLGGTWNGHPRLTGVSVHNSQAGVGVTVKCRIRGSRSVNGHLEILVTRRGNLGDILLRPIMPKGEGLHPETVRGIAQPFQRFENVANFYFDPSQWTDIQAAEVITDLQRNGFQTHFPSHYFGSNQRYILNTIDQLKDQYLTPPHIQPELARLHSLFSGRLQNWPTTQALAENNILPITYTNKILVHTTIAITQP